MLLCHLLSNMQVSPCLSSWRYPRNLSYWDIIMILYIGKAAGIEPWKCGEGKRYYSLCLSSSLCVWSRGDVWKKLYQSSEGFFSLQLRALGTELQTPWNPNRCFGIELQSFERLFSPHAFLCEDTFKSCWINFIIFSTKALSTWKRQAWNSRGLRCETITTWCSPNWRKMEWKRGRDMSACSGPRGGEVWDASVAFSWR